MPFGSVFSRFEGIDLVTADDIHVHIKNNFLSRAGFRIFGLPHIGIRLRARKIMKNINKPERMLDAGCGTGVYSFSLAKKIDKIEAVDISEEKIENAGKISIFKNITFKQGDLCNLKFDSNSFDLAICSDVLEHIKNDKKAMSELMRVLKPNGMLLLTVPSCSYKNKRTYKNYNHERAGYTTRDIEKILFGNGRIIQAEGYSSAITEILSGVNYKLVSNKIFLALFFYPLYALSLVSDIISRKGHNGMFFRIIKN